MGWFSDLTDDVLGLDPGGGGVYGAARDVFGDTIADDVLGMDPNGKGFVKGYNVALPMIAAYYGGQALGNYFSSGSGAASSGTGLTAGGSGVGLTSGGGVGLTAPTAAATSSAPSWLSSIGSSAASYLSNPSNLTSMLSVAGGLLGASDGATDSKSSNQYKMDSRLDPLVYGTPKASGLLGDANALYKMQLASGGMNDTMRNGLGLQRNVLNSPQYTKGYDTMRNMGQSMMNAKVAGNPFLTGKRTL